MLDGSGTNAGDAGQENVRRKRFQHGCVRQVKHGSRRVWIGKYYDNGQSRARVLGLVAKMSEGEAWAELQEKYLNQSEFVFGHERGDSRASDLLKSTGIESAPVCSSSGSTFESHRIKDLVLGRGATSQGIQAPTIRSEARTGTDKRKRPRDQE